MCLSFVPGMCMRRPLRWWWSKDGAGEPGCRGFADIIRADCSAVPLLRGCAAFFCCVPVLRASAACLCCVPLQGSVVVIRGEGPKGGPGMPEMLTPTSAIMGAGLGKVRLSLIRATLRYNKNVPLIFSLALQGTILPRPSLIPASAIIGVGLGSVVLNA